MEQRSQIEPDSFDLKLYNSRVDRKSVKEHPLFDKKRKDFDLSTMYDGDELQDISVQIINDRYPMPNRINYNSNDITT